MAMGKCILWRDRMDVPSKCTVVRTTGRSACRLKAKEQSVVGAEATLSAIVKTHKRIDCIPCP
jgi:hypothetical protein